MVILRVHENSSVKGGSEVYVRDICVELEKRGIANHVLFIEADMGNYSISFDGSSLHSVPRGEIKSKLDSLLAKFSIDIVHIHGLSDPGLVKYFLDRYKVVRTMHEPRMVCPGYGKFWVKSGKPCTTPYGLHCFYHAYSEQCFRSRKPLNVYRAFRNTEFEVHYASKRYAAILTMSEFVRNEAIKGGISPDRIICNPHFSKFNLPFTPFSGDRREVLYIGRLIVHKGIKELLLAMKPILQEDQKVSLRLVGDGPMYTYVVNFVEENALESQVTIEKWKSSAEVSDLMKRAYCVVFPSIYPEAFGLVGIEAAMHSRPVVGFDRGGISTWLKDGFNGYLVDDVSSYALERAVRVLLLDFDKYSEMSVNAWKFANSFFSSDRHVSTLVDIYKNCCGV